MTTTIARYLNGWDTYYLFYNTAHLEGENTPGAFVFQNEDFRVTLKSADESIVYDAQGNVVSGTIDEIEFVDLNGDILSILISGINIDASEIYARFDAGQAPHYFAELFNLDSIHYTGGGAFTGGSHDDTLEGGGTLNGAGGDDVVLGGSNLDQLDGGDGDDTLSGGGYGDTLVGGEGDDLLSGGVHNDYLYAASGSDTVDGGEGNDSYWLESNTEITLADSGGNDRIISDITRDLELIGGDIETLIITRDEDEDLYGNDLDNTLDGSHGDNILEGRGGLDTLIGGAGKDTYVLGTEQDIVDDSSGIDTITTLISRSLVPYDLSYIEIIENLTLEGSDDIDGIGNRADNIIRGNSGDNILDGGAGVDTLSGGDGNDSYIIDSLDDVITDSSGIDTIVARLLAVTLQSGIENLDLLEGQDAFGNSLDNRIEGNDADNNLAGFGGADTLVGGLGSDTYDLGSEAEGVDTVVDAGGAADTIITGISRSLVGYDGIENLILVSTAKDGTGNDLANVITGNSVGNVLQGGLSQDQSRDDHVGDTLAGLGGSDTLIAGHGDELLGGLGDDTYIVTAAVIHDGVADFAITELAGEGIDMVEAAVDVSLVGQGSVENLRLSGAAKIGEGNQLDNLIEGSDRKNALLGLDGDDTLVGGGGKDTLDGGAGDDTYILGDAATIVIIDASGADLATSTISRSLQSSASIENLQLLGDGDLRGIGNDAANQLGGTVGDNVLKGLGGDDALVGGDGADKLTGGDGRDVLGAGKGDDVLRGGIGRDLLTGGTGRDVFDFNSTAEVGTGSARDVITDFDDRRDLIDFSNIDADVDTKGNGTFAFLKTENAAFTGDAGELRWFRQNLIGTDQDKTFVEGDVDGDGTADFRLTLDGLHALKASQFIL